MLVVSATPTRVWLMMSVCASEKARFQSVLHWRPSTPTANPKQATSNEGFKELEVFSLQPLGVKCERFLLAAAVTTKALVKSQLRVGRWERTSHVVSHVFNINEKWWWLDDWRGGGGDGGDIFIVWFKNVLLLDVCSIMDLHWLNWRRLGNVGTWKSRIVYDL